MSNSGKNRVKDVVLCRHNQREDPSGMEPVISIIIPHYNNIKGLRDTLNSIELSVVTVTVVDDCSTKREGVEELKRDFPTVQFL